MRRVLALLLLLCGCCGLTPVAGWREYAVCPNCGRVVWVNEIRLDKCRGCEYGWR